MPKTLFDKLWSNHEVTQLADGSSLLYIDRVFMHERTGSIALTSLAENGRQVRNPAHVFCAMDHIIDTFPGRGDQTLMPGGTEFITTTRATTRQAGIRLFDVNDPDQGISHLISAEQGITLPGFTVVCPDSHTCTLGALGAFAWGIGSSDCEQVLATETLRSQKPKQMRVRFDGELNPGVTAKDLILFLISQYGANGGNRMVIEFCGTTIDQLSMEARFTLCNMATEFSAFTALIAPDNTTIDYVRGRTFAPADNHLEASITSWRSLHTEQDATFEQEIVVDVTTIVPMVSWGTSPEHSVRVDAPMPQLDSDSQEAQDKLKAMRYMGFEPGQVLLGTAIQGAFIGSCTNGRLSDLQAAANVLKGRHVDPGVTAICTPGSQQVKRRAEALGLDKVFIAAGFEWREPGCSLCFYAGGEGFSAGQRVMSTTNRNFEGRQGRGARTHIASPIMVAAAAIAGKITDCREFL